jgi:DNA repair photolyase
MIEPFIKFLPQLNVPTIFHATITTLGHSVLEPNIPDRMDSIRHLSELCKSFSPDNVVLRVDPLVPFVTDLKNVESIIMFARSFGITKCRTSVIDYYPFVRKRFDDIGIRRFGNNSFVTPYAYRVGLLKSFTRICKRNDMTAESCAEDVDVDGLFKVGCASKAVWNGLGVKIDDVCKRKQRKECFCDIDKNDILKGYPTCKNKCLYCYFSKYV